MNTDIHPPYPFTPLRVYCPVCACQMLPGDERAVGDIPERICKECAAKVSRFLALAREAGHEVA